MDRGAWWTIVHGVAKSQTRLRNLAHRHLQINIYIFYISHMIVFFSEYLGGNSRYPLPLNICSCDPKDRTLFTTHTVTESQEM